MEEHILDYNTEACAVPPKMGDLRPVNIPVQMMAVTDRDGKVTPLWFRFEAEDHHIEKVAIERTISRDESIFVGVREKRFVCSVVIGAERHLIELRYHIENQKWRIFQFLS